MTTCRISWANLPFSLALSSCGANLYARTFCDYWPSISSATCTARRLTCVPAKPIFHHLWSTVRQENITNKWLCIKNEEGV